MKKKILSLLLALAMCLSLSVPAFAVENSPSPELESASTTTLPESDENTYYFIDPALESAKTRAGSEYLYSYYSLVEQNLITAFSSPEINHVFIISVAKGYTVRTKESVTTSGSIKFAANVESDIKQAIKNKVGANASFFLSFTVEKDREFKFPEDEPGNTASYYTSIGFDEYQFIYAKYDVYQGQSGGIGVGLEHRFVENVSRIAEIPKEVILYRTAYA